jgi:hypothetical protein
MAPGRDEVPSPQRSDLLTDLILLDRTSLEHAIDRFLEQSEALGAGLSRLGGPSYLLTGATAAAVALAASKAIPRLLARSPDDEAVLAGAGAGDYLDGFPGPAGP